MNNYDSLYIDIQNQQVQIDTIEGIVNQGGDAGKKLNVRLTQLESDSTSISADIDVLQTDTTNINVNVNEIKNTEIDLSVQVHDLEVRVDDIEGAIGIGKDAGFSLNTRIITLEEDSNTIKGDIIDIQNVDIDI